MLLKPMLLTKSVVACCLAIGWLHASEPAYAKSFLETVQLNLPKSDVTGERFSLDREARFYCFIFLGVECPVARQYGAKLPLIAERYTNQPVQFIGVNSNLQDSGDEVADFRRELKIAFPILKDSEQRLARHFSATRTAEAVVIDTSGTILYRGRIDDQFSPGVTRGETTSHDLRNALDALVAGQPVAVRETSPVGCLITFKKQEVAKPTVTFTKDVAPMLWQNCYECHRAGEIGPFDISDYDDLLGWGEMLVEVMEQKRMPPWHASPEFGSFKNERLLPAGASELVRSWIDQGMPYGNNEELPPLPTYTDGWRLPKEPDMVIEMRDRPFHVAADKTIDYQYFVVDPGFEEDKWVSASQVIPGAPSVVHHAIVFVRPPDSGEFVGIGWLNAYVPGQVPVVYPPGYARKVPAGSKLVFQMHYTPSGAAAEDITRIGLNFVEESEVTHQVYTLVAIDQDFEIPPHAPAHAVPAEMQSFPRMGHLLSISPHMHLRGKSFEAFARKADQQAPLLKVPHYDFNWQHTYEFREPIDLRRWDGIGIVATFDNSKENPFNPNPNEYVMWGDQTWEEMTLGYFDVAIPLNGRVLADMVDEDWVATDDTAVDEVSSDAVTTAGVTANDAISDNERFAQKFATDFFKRYDSNRDGYLTRQEVPRIFRDYGFWRVDTDYDGKITKDELISAARGSRERKR